MISKTKGRKGGLLILLGIVALPIALLSWDMETRLWVLGNAWAASQKILLNARHCPWPRVLSFYSANMDLLARVQGHEEQASVADTDAAVGIQLVRHPSRSFWVRASGERWAGVRLIPYLLAEHEWMSEHHPASNVRSGDIVLDCGAHVGVFTQQALDRGASKVVAIDPDPVQLECLRRNFAEDIEAGRVVLVEKGVWSSGGTLALNVGVQNSGMSSLVEPTGGETIDVPVTTIDDLVGELGLERVDYIKMDIEGAEREALRGGLRTISKFRPRILLETYHRPDDMEVLPEILYGAYPGYTAYCGDCEFTEDPANRLVPHFTYWE